MTLYKYLPSARIDVLTHRRIRFSPPRDLNDWWEARPIVRANLRSVRRRAQREFGNSEHWSSKVDEFARFAETEGTERLRTEVDRHFGVLSLSRDPLNRMMWSQYAEGYRGFLIGFDGGHEWLVGPPGSSDPTDGVRRVRYAWRRPAVEVGEGDDVNRAAFAVGSILTKHRAWAHEREWRMLRQSGLALPVAQCSGVSHLFPFPGDSVLEVVLGPAMSEEDREAIRRALVGGQYPRAVVRRLVIPSGSFALAIADG
jgi:hypothetical protein